MGMIHYNRRKSRERLLQGDMPKWISNSSRAAYIAKIVVSVPPWVDQKDLLQLNALAARISKATGIPHHLDHIVPVTHPEVCGLTVPWNLRIAPYRVNLAKGNRWCPDQLGLFDDIPTEDEALAEYLQHVCVDV
jgi:hypothetical protein